MLYVHDRLLLPIEGRHRHLHIMISYSRSLHFTTRTLLTIKMPIKAETIDKDDRDKRGRNNARISVY